MRILKDQTLAVVIDVQERLFPSIHEKETLSRNMQVLIAGLKTLDVPIIVTEQYKKGLGQTIPEISSLVKHNPHYEKIAFSCCDDTPFMNAVNVSKAKNVILAGIESHICVMQTAIDLLEKGYQPVVVADCVASRDPGNKRLALDRMLQLGITVTSYESLLFELCRFAGTVHFKEISKLVK